MNNSNGIYNQEDLKIIQEYRNEIDSTASEEDILDKYEGEFISIKNLIEYLLEIYEINIPDWIKIDYETTWECNVKFDFDITTNYIFRI